MFSGECLSGSVCLTVAVLHEPGLQEVIYPAEGGSVVSDGCWETLAASIKRM